MWVWGDRLIWQLVCDTCEYDPVIDSEHVEEAGGTVERVGLDNALVQQ